jgi:hypothetical protein
MVRAAALALPWLAVVTVSVSLAYGMDVAMTSGVSTSTSIGESVSTEAEHSHLSQDCATQPLYVGQNSWVPLRSRCTYALP